MALAKRGRLIGKRQNVKCQALGRFLADSRRLPSSRLSFPVLPEKNSYVLTPSSQRITDRISAAVFQSGLPQHTDLSGAVGRLEDMLPATSNSPRRQCTARPFPSRCRRPPPARTRGLFLDHFPKPGNFGQLVGHKTLTAEPWFPLVMTRTRSSSSRKGARTSAGVSGFKDSRLFYRQPDKRNRFPDLFRRVGFHMENDDIGPASANGRNSGRAA